MMRLICVRFVYFQVCGFFERSKYYAIWTLTEVSSCVSRRE
jgi:lysophospholipid acyltransferase